MLGIGYWMPLDKPWRFINKARVDMTPWRYGTPVAITMVSCMIMTYLVFSPVGLVNGVSSRFWYAIATVFVVNALLCWLSSKYWCKKYIPPLSYWPISTAQQFNWCIIPKELLDTMTQSFNILSSEWDSNYHCKVLLTWTKARAKSKSTVNKQEVQTALIIASWFAPVFGNKKPFQIFFISPAQPTLWKLSSLTSVTLSKYRSGTEFFSIGNCMLATLFKTAV